MQVGLARGKIGGLSADKGADNKRFANYSGQSGRGFGGFVSKLGRDVREKETSGEERTCAARRMEKRHQRTTKSDKLPAIKLNRESDRV